MLSVSSVCVSHVCLCALTVCEQTDDDDDDQDDDDYYDQDDNDDQDDDEASACMRACVRACICECLTHLHHTHRPSQESPVDSETSTPPDPSIVWSVPVAARTSRTAAKTSRASRKPRRAAAPPSRKPRRRAAAPPPQTSRAATSPPKPTRATRKSSRRDAGAAPKTNHASSLRPNSSPTIHGWSLTDGPVSICVGDKVEVFWDTMGKWYAGEVVALDESDQTYMVHYFADHEEYWHPGPGTMDVRRLP